MQITYFRPRRCGPEIKLENAVVKQIPYLFPSDNRLLWTAGSLPLGAGMPDLVIVSYEPEVFALSQLEMIDVHILAYLRTVGRASINTITERIGFPREKTVSRLKRLVGVNTILNNSNTFSLSPAWREILPEIITIEVKVRKWRKAIEQASRNRIFAHKSFVALPLSLAQRVRLEPIFRQFGIGLISVSDNSEVFVVRRARHQTPRVWTYYYQVAYLIAKHFSEMEQCHMLCQ